MRSGLVRGFFSLQKRSLGAPPAPGTSVGLADEAAARQRERHVRIEAMLAKQPDNDQILFAIFHVTLIL